MKRVWSSGEIESESESERGEKKKGLGLVSESEPEKKREVYAVFEFNEKLNDAYYIYKLDMADDDEREFREPIHIVKLKHHHPMSMSIFSIRSKIYFCGGYWYKPDSPLAIFSCQAYMFDLASNRGTSIQSMNFPKPISFVFGPFDGDIFYLFSPSRSVMSNVFHPSLEFLDTSSNTWESINLHPSFTGLTFNTASSLCGSNILLASSDLSHLYVFSTKSKTWRVIKRDPHVKGPNCLPFSKARYLGAVKTFGHILLGFPYIAGMPQLYSSKAGYDNGEVDIGPFMKLGELEGFRENFKTVRSFLGGLGWGTMIGRYYFDCDSICLVRTVEPHYRCVVEQLLIDIFDISYSGLDDTGVEVKAKVKNAVQYKYVCKIPMRPRHFLAVG